MKIQGQCHCGAIAYEAEIDPADAVVCHCTDCQVLSGAPFRASVPAKAEDFHLLRGTPTIYVKTADGGTKRAHAFCPVCGAPLYAAAADTPTLYMLRLGAIKQRAQIPALRRIWCNSSLPWAEDIHALPGTPKG